jgi:hypothetical protein
MKYQLNIIKNLFSSKYYKLILFYLVFYLLMYVILKVQYPVFSVSNFITMVGFIDFYNTSFLELIYFVLEVLMIIYSLYLYFSYEEDNSLEYIILRKNIKVNFIEKYIVSFLVLLIIRIFTYSITSLLFSGFGNLVMFKALVFFDLELTIIVGTLYILKFFYKRGALYK